METFQGLVARLSKAVGCHYHRCDSGIYSLKKFNTEVSHAMGVFAWVVELKRKGIFRVDTYRDLADIAGVRGLADGEKPRLIWNQWGVFFYVKKGNTDKDYQKAVKALRAILTLK